MVDRIIDPAAAARAYQASPVKTGLAGGDKIGALNKNNDISFPQFLKEKLGDSITTMREGEKMSAKAVTGEADITDVVQAVTDAEITLQTIVAVRDRLVSAYQEIMRMPI